MSQPAVVSLALPATPQAPARARQALREVCREVPRSLLDDALLLTSELVTNAVDHAGGPLVLRVECDGARICVSLTDASADPPVLREPDSHQDRGRGLRLVDALADSWRCRPTAAGEGKTVYFEVTLASTSRALGSG